MKALTYYVLFLLIYMIDCNSLHNKIMSSKDPLIFVMYYTKWCGHSVRFLPVYRALRRKYKDVVPFHKIDCEKYPKYCRERSIKGYPTIITYRTADYIRGNMQKWIEPYEGQRDRKTLEAYVRSRYPNAVRSFKEFIGKGSHNTCSPLRAFICGDKIGLVLRKLSLKFIKEIEFVHVKEEQYGTLENYFANQPGPTLGQSIKVKGNEIILETQPDLKRILTLRRNYTEIFNEIIPFTDIRFSTKIKGIGEDSIDNQCTKKGTLCIVTSIGEYLPYIKKVEILREIEKHRTAIRNREERLLFLYRIGRGNSTIHRVLNKEEVKDGEVVILNLSENMILVTNQKNLTNIMKDPIQFRSIREAREEL